MELRRFFAHLGRTTRYESQRGERPVAEPERKRVFSRAVLVVLVLGWVLVSYALWAMLHPRR